MYVTGSFNDFEKRLHQFGKQLEPYETGANILSGFNNFLTEGSGYLQSSGVDLATIYRWNKECSKQHASDFNYTGLGFNTRLLRPIQVSPANGMTILNSSPLTPLDIPFSFRAVPEASHYRIRTNQVGGTGGVLSSNWLTAEEVGALSETQIGTIYFNPTYATGLCFLAWSVSPRFEISTGLSSISRDLHLSTPYPLSLTPARSTITSNTTPTLTFSAVSGATDYRAYFFQLISGIQYYSSWVSASGAGIPSGIGTGTLVMDSPLPVGFFEWNMTAKFQETIGTTSTSNFQLAII